MRVTIEARTLRFRSPLQASYGEIDRREIFELEIAGDDGVRGRGEAAPLEAYDGVSPTARAPRSTPTAPSSRTATRPCPAAICSTPAAPRTTCPKRSRPWTWRCGTARDGAPAARSHGC